MVAVSLCAANSFVPQQACFSCPEAVDNVCWSFWFSLHPFCLTNTQEEAEVSCSTALLSTHRAFSFFSGFFFLCVCVWVDSIITFKCHVHSNCTLFFGCFMILSVCLSCTFAGWGWGWGGGGGLSLCVVWASLLLTSIGSEHLTVLFFSFI